VVTSWRSTSLTRCRSFHPLRIQPSISRRCGRLVLRLALRGRPLGRFGSSCVTLSSTRVEPSAGEGVAGCLPFPFAGARFLGVGRVASGRLTPFISFLMGGFEERPPSTLSCCLRFALLKSLVSRPALDHPRSVFEDDEGEAHQPLTALSFLPFPIFSLTAFHLPSPSSLTTSINRLSSSSVHVSLLIFGSNLSFHRSLHCSLLLPSIIAATSTHEFPYAETARCNFASSAGDHGPRLRVGSRDRWYRF
jgi:hypothetical protein